MALPGGDELSDFLKRAIDLISATVGMVVLAPIFGAVAVAVRCKLGQPVLFRQERAGRNGHPFEMIKFRSMLETRGEDDELLPDADRITTFGSWLRATSLDELPELIHVVRGDMSLVGPRPLPTEYLERYSLEQARRHEVRPGLTGWSQVNGRNATTWAERLAMDVWYVDHRSIRLDLRIIARTFGLVLRRTGIAQEGEATMPTFMGNS